MHFQLQLGTTASALLLCFRCATTERLQVQTGGIGARRRGGGAAVFSRKTHGIRTLGSCCLAVLDWRSDSLLLPTCLPTYSTSLYFVPSWPAPVSSSAPAFVVALWCGSRSRLVGRAAASFRACGCWVYVNVTFTLGASRGNMYGQPAGPVLLRGRVLCWLDARRTS